MHPPLNTLKNLSIVRNATGTKHKYHQMRSIRATLGAALTCGFSVAAIWPAHLEEKEEQEEAASRRADAANMAAWCLLGPGGKY
jgi:hypothetical protein